MSWEPPPYRQGFYNGFSKAHRWTSIPWMRTAWATGQLLHIPSGSACDSCGSTKYITEHAEDYSSPFGPHLAAFWLCHLCHAVVHARGPRPQVFRNYIESLQDGFHYQPTRDSDAISRTMAELEDGAPGQAMLFTESTTRGQMLLDIADGIYDPRNPDRLPGPHEAEVQGPTR